jgi:hypothetical protein
VTDWHTQRVRERAYAIWEEEGSPHGSDLAHWFRAEAELRAALAKRAAMHEELWAGVDSKIANAAFFIEETAGLFDWPNGSAAARAIAAGVNVEMPLQCERSFYAHLDAFLVTARSVPEVINCCFGKDTITSEMRNWFASLSAAEQTRRSEFLRQFQSTYDNFRNLPLSKERNISYHRTGYPAVEGKITGRYGVYIGSPINRLPTVESEPLIARDTDALKWAATQPPPPIRATASDFTIGGASLFPECRSYLEQANCLVSQARAIAQLVHGADVLTPPP